eukprot:UN3816
MDDANVPSLLSLPYIDPRREAFDEKVYSDTRRFILSKENPWYFEGTAGRGIGSPHTGPNRIWPLALVMQAITATSDKERSEVMQMLMHPKVFSEGLVESFDKDDLHGITRPWFGWPNALFGEYLLTRNKCNPNLAGARFPN